MGTGQDPNNQGYASRLPPSGPTAPQNLPANSPWNQPPPEPTADVTGVDGADGAVANPPSSGGAPDAAAGVGLASLEPLRNALPDVPGAE